MRPPQIHGLTPDKIGAAPDDSFIQQLRHSLMAQYKPEDTFRSPSLSEAHAARLNGARQSMTRNAGTRLADVRQGAGTGMDGYDLQRLNNLALAERGEYNNQGEERPQAAAAPRQAPTPADYQQALATASPVQGQPVLSAKEQLQQANAQQKQGEQQQKQDMELSKSRLQQLQQQEADINKRTVNGTLQPEDTDTLTAIARERQALQSKLLPQGDPGQQAFIPGQTAFRSGQYDPTMGISQPTTPVTPASPQPTAPPAQPTTQPTTQPAWTHPTSGRSFTDGQIIHSPSTGRMFKITNGQPVEITAPAPQPSGAQ